MVEQPSKNLRNSVDVDPSSKAMDLFRCYIRFSTELRSSTRRGYKEIRNSELKNLSSYEQNQPSKIHSCCYFSLRIICRFRGHF